MWLSLPLGALFLALVTKVFSLWFPQSVLLQAVDAVTHWIFSAAALSLNIYSVAELIPFDFGIAVAELCFLSFWLAVNIAFSGFLFWLYFERGIPRHRWHLVLCVVAPLDLGVFFLGDPDRKISQEISALRIGTAFFQFLPLLVLQLFSLEDVAPPGVICAVIFNSFGLGLALIQEISLWSLYVRTNDVSSRQNTLQTPLLDGDSVADLQGGEGDDVEEEEVNEEPKIFFRWLNVAVFPLVALSLLPQLITVIGIPWTATSLRRFLFSSDLGASTSTRGLSPLQKRGLFLLALNWLSFVAVLLLILPFLSAAGLFFAFYNKLNMQRTGEKAKIFGDFRASLQSLISVMAFCYLPLLSTPPVIRVEKFTSQKVLSKWKIVFVVLLLLVTEVALPIVGTVTDVNYSLHLLDISSDPTLSDRGTLFIWTVVSFAAGALGLALSLATFLLLISPWLQAPSARAFLDVIIGASVFGRLNPSKWKLSALQFVHLLFVDIVQLLMMKSTISFVGRVNPLWTFKLAISLLSAAFRLSGLLLEFVFGKKISGAAKLGLRPVYFVLVGTLLTLPVFFSLDDDFCGLSRGVHNSDILTVLEGCDIISGQITVSGNQDSVQGTMNALNITAGFEISNNEEVILVFPQLVDISSILNVSSNTGAVNISFPSLEEVSEGGSLVAEGNSAELTLSLPLLFGVEGDLVVQLNSNPGIFDLPALALVNGRVLIAQNSFSGLSLSLLTEIYGTVTITNEMTTDLQLESLFDITGLMELRGNPNLKSLTFPSLLQLQGWLVIEDNKSLVECSFPQPLSLCSMNISSNPTLERILLPEMTELEGSVTFDNNPLLTDVYLPLISQIAQGSQILISMNPSLLTLDLRNVVCNLPFSMIFRNNANLATVFLQSDSCLNNIVNEGNPNMKYVFSET